MFSQSARFSPWQKLSLCAIATLFVAAGSLHLVRPQPFREIMPPSIPSPDLMVTLSGVAELAGGIGILISALRPAARWGLVALLIAVFPANIYMAQRRIAPGGLHIPAALLWARLTLQPLLIWWVLAATRPKQPLLSA